MATTTSQEELEFSSNDNNKTQELKGLLEKITSLSTVETDILKAMVDLSKGLKE